MTKLSKAFGYILDTFQVFCTDYTGPLFVQPACDEGDIVVTTSVRCKCGHVCVRPSGFVRAITYTFVHVFQTDLHSSFSSVVEVPFDACRLKFKVTMNVK